MDASYKIQRGIHVHLIQFFMCPEFWVHIIALFLSIVLMVFLLSACSNNNTECKLSELKDDKLIQYITDSKIAIPEDIDIDTIRGMIIELENNLDHPAPVMGYTLVADLYEDLRNLVVEYEPSKE